MKELHNFFKKHLKKIFFVGLFIYMLILIVDPGNRFGRNEQIQNIQTTEQYIFNVSEILISSGGISGGKSFLKPTTIKFSVQQDPADNKKVKIILFIEPD